MRPSIHRKSIVHATQCHERNNEKFQYDDLPWIVKGSNFVPSPYNGLNYNNFIVGQYPWSGVIKLESGKQHAESNGGMASIAIANST
jgi:hypothetical protein